MFESIFDGLMLGDGYLLMKKGSRNAIYGHSCKEYEYIEWLVNCITKSNFNHNHKIYNKDNGYNTGRVYQFYTRVNPWLTEQYRRWYPDGKKVVPSDLALTKDILRHWYIGDGCLDSAKNYLRQIAISSHSFSKECREFLCHQIRSLGFKASNRENGLICIPKTSVKPFLEYIGDPETSCYRYKWDIQKYVGKQPKYS